MECVMSVVEWVQSGSIGPLATRTSGYGGSGADDAGGVDTVKCRSSAKCRTCAANLHPNLHPNSQIVGYLKADCLDCVSRRVEAAATESRMCAEQGTK
eukprot:9327107-Pyramimonas_sp.AAC.1